jgi:hypothetical protein
MQRNLLSLKLLAAALTLVMLGFSAQAQEKKADPTGTWTWSTPVRDGGTARVTTLKLKAEGEKLTGTISMPGRQGAEPRETQIQNGKIKGDEISFTLTREFGGNTMTSKYTGKVSGDVIKGKMEFERNNETQSREWEAKRAPADKK